jgi:hypothetical protein
MRFYTQQHRFYAGVDRYDPGKKSRSLTRPRCALLNFDAIKRFGTSPYFFPERL